MAIEFTGERVVPGQVDPDLWNEHVARYAFAARLARAKRVLDLGCGTGYGAAELARTAASVVGLDVSVEATRFAAANFAGGGVRLVQASATGLPFADRSFDLVAAFEVIEHVEDWEALLGEARRVLAPGGQLVISTPNKSYYAKTREISGPNPFHQREFDFEEFREALASFFPHVSLYLQNHCDGIVFQPTAPSRSWLGSGSRSGVESWLGSGSRSGVESRHGSGPRGGMESPGGSESRLGMEARLRSGSELRIEPAGGAAGDAHFFVAVCASVPQTGAPTFVYIPSTANVLRERELHIERLEAELKQKDAWLEQSLEEHRGLVEEHTRQTAQLDESNRWAKELSEKLDAAGRRIVALQEELEREQQEARNVVAGYEAALDKLETEIESQIALTNQTRETLTAELNAKCAELDAKCGELARSVELLKQADAAVEERTNWALQLDAEVQALRRRLEAIENSRWLRFGRALRVGPTSQAR